MVNSYNAIIHYLTRYIACVWGELNAKREGVIDSVLDFPGAYLGRYVIAVQCQWGLHRRYDAIGTEMDIGSISFQLARHPLVP